MQKLLLVKYICVSFILQGITFSHNCSLLEVYDVTKDTLEVFENNNVSVKFWLNTSACEQSDVRYGIDVNTKTDMNTQEYEGKIVQQNGQCTGILGPVECVSSVGPAVLYKKLNRSHVEIEWTWTWKNKSVNSLTTSKKVLKLDIRYPPSVESLTVNGQEANGTYLLNNGQKVNVSCSFEKGNPASSFHLLDQNGAEMSTSDKEEHISHSLVVHCEDDWPVISCKGKESKQNRSVSFLVKCPPQFVNKTVKIDSSLAEQTITIHVKSYSSAKSECVLTPLSSYNKTHRHVNCNLSGEPPDLVLSFYLGTEDSSIEEWMLIYKNEGGSANITVIVNKYLEAFTDKDDKTNPVIFTFSVLPIGIVIVLVIVVALVLRNRKRIYGNGTSLQDEMGDSRGNVGEDVSNLQTYVSASTVRNIKKVQRKGQSSSGSAEDTYTSATEVRAKKSLNKHDAVTCDVGDADVTASSELMAGASTSRRKNSDGLIYGDLDFSNTRTCNNYTTESVSETEYAAINVTAVVPPPRDYRKRIDKVNYDKRDYRN